MREKLKNLCFGSGSTDNQRWLQANHSCLQWFGDSILYQMKLNLQINQGSPLSTQKINLKEMLNYYKDSQTPLPNEDYDNSPLQYDDVYTEKVKLPPPKYDHFAFTTPLCSQQLQKGSPLNSHSVSTFINFRVTEQTGSHKNKEKSKLTRESISLMNKKFRNIRTSHYRANSEKHQENLSRVYDKQLKENDKMIIRKIQRSYSGALSRNTGRSPTLRPSSNMMERKASMVGRMQSTEGLQNKGKRVYSVKKRIEEVVEMKKNQLVIYPFESKFKVKRIDDNPKILTNIILKKSKHLSKQDLYVYINSLINRREK